MTEKSARDLRDAAQLMKEQSEVATQGSCRPVAGLHPGVGVAVASWLKEVADNRHPELPAWVEEAALKVARAYLGTSA